MDTALSRTSWPGGGVGPGGRSPDERMATLAARQNGVVARAQLVACGLGPGAIRHRVRRGRLHRLHRGVYLVGHPVLAPLAAETAAVLAAGGVLSHESAAFLHGLGPPPSSPHVTVTGRDARRPGMVVHRAALRPEERTRRHGLPATSVPRTLLDLADTLPPPQLEQTVAEALRTRRTTPAALHSFADQAIGRHGTKALKTILDHGPAFTRSEAERRLVALVRAAGLPCPLVNHRLLGLEVDFLWPGERLVVEVDGYAYHSSRAAFQRDRERDARLQTAGYRVLRVTWLDLTERPSALVARLAVALSLRP